MAGIKLEADEILWKDRKRHLGLPISFTHYEVTKDRVTIHRGLLRTETDELLLYRILDIKLVRTLGQKIFGMGTVTLYSADQTHSTTELKNIAKSNDVRLFLSKIVEQERAAKGLTGREIYGAAGMMADEDGGGGPLPFMDADGDGMPG